MENNKKSGYIIPIDKYSSMLGEWVYNIIRDAEYETNDETNEVLKTKIMFRDGISNEVISEHVRKGEVSLIDDSVKISTAEILNSEFRGVFEQCFEIDEYLNSGEKDKQDSSNGDSFEKFVKKLKGDHEKLSVEESESSQENACETPLKKQ